MQTTLFLAGLMGLTLAGCSGSKQTAATPPASFASVHPRAELAGGGYRSQPTGFEARTTGGPDNSPSTDVSSGSLITPPGAGARAAF